MKRVDLKITFACNNKCKFCIQWDKRFSYPEREYKDLCETLDKEKEKRIKYLVLTWGEPTMHPYILDIVEYAKNIGFEEIQLQCNGRTLADKNYCKKLIERGITEFWPSIHGYYKKTHDWLVDRDWAWEDTMKGIINMKQLWKRVIINTVITKQNYEELPKMAKLFVSLWIEQFQFAFPHIGWSAYKNYKEIIPTKTECISYIHKWLDIGRNGNSICMVEAMPFCFMQWYERAIAEYNYMPDATVYDSDFALESYDEWKLNEWKAKWEACKKCSKKHICEWPWKEYVELFGWDEFKTI